MNIRQFIANKREAGREKHFRNVDKQVKKSEKNYVSTETLGQRVEENRIVNNYESKQAGIRAAVKEQRQQKFRNFGQGLAKVMNAGKKSISGIGSQGRTTGRRTRGSRRSGGSRASRFGSGLARTMNANGGQSSGMEFGGNQGGSPFSTPTRNLEFGGSNNVSSRMELRGSSSPFNQGNSAKPKKQKGVMIRIR